MKYAILLAIVAGIAYYLGTATSEKQASPGPAPEAPWTKVDKPAPQAVLTSYSPPPQEIPQPKPVIVEPGSTVPTGPVVSPAIVAAPPKSYVPPDPLPAQPNLTWTVLGKDYNHVIVTRAEADCVHITYDGGLGAINMTDLPPDLQKAFNYDPAAAAQTARDKAEAQARIDAEEAPKIAALQRQEKAQADAEAAQAASAAAQGSAAESADARVDYARNHIPPVQDDLNFVMRHMYVDPRTGQASGDAYFLKKYYDDTRVLNQYHQIIASGGK
jgi:hypothetical protein